MSAASVQTEGDATVVATIRKNATEELRFGLQTYKGHRLVSARVWAQKPDGSFVPTKAGLTTRIDLLSDVRKALEMVEQAAREAGWLGAMAARGADQ